jgi:hypothetical protein
MATALSLPVAHVEPSIAHAGKAISPIALKPQATKAPSKTVKMFFPGDDDDDDAAPSAAADAGSKANLIPPVKDAPASFVSAGPSKSSEFVASKLSSTSAVASPATSPALSRYSAGSPPLQKTNGSAANHGALPPPHQNTRAHTSPVKPPLTPDIARVVRDDAFRSSPTSPLAGLGSMPPPASMRGRTNQVPELPPPNITRFEASTTPSKSSVEPPSSFAPENKTVRAVASNSNLKRADRVPTKVPKTASDYQIICQVGEGTFGKVYKARSVTNTDTFVALKRIRMEGEKDGFPVTAMREIKLLQSLQHENVVNLHEMMVAKGVCWSLDSL